MDTILFIGLIYKKPISISDIDNYVKTIHKNNVKVFEGVLLKLKNNKTIQLAGQNLKSISQMKEYLNEKNINCLGEISFQLKLRKT